MAHILANSGNGSQLLLTYASTLNYISLKLSDLLCFGVWIFISRNYGLPHSLFVQGLAKHSINLYSPAQYEQLAVCYHNGLVSTCPCFPLNCKRLNNLGK